MKIQVADIVEESIVDGPGLRMTVFVQGCYFKCPGCHNPQTHDVNGGTEMEVDDIVELAAKNPLLRGITISGGEPFLQANACAELARKAKDLGLDVWVYTGYIFPLRALWGYELLDYTDVLVDGPFVEAEKSLGLKWRGSANQRIIDVQMSRKCEAIVIYEE